LIREEDKKMIQAKKDYQRDMKDVAKKFVRNYMECEYFTKLNKKIFGVLLLTQLISAMTFNGFHDIPILFFIIILMSLYSIRH